MASVSLLRIGFERSDFIRPARLLSGASWFWIIMQGESILRASGIPVVPA